MASDQHPADRPAAVRLPLSAAQRDIWMAHDADRTGRRYNVGESREILGPIDGDVLADCWYQLVREADVLRVRGTECDDDGIWQLVRSLPGKQRTAVTLRYLADLSHREIAAVMETSEDAARRNVFEGLRRLRASIGDGA